MFEYLPWCLSDNDDKETREIVALVSDGPGNGCCDDDDKTALTRRRQKRPPNSCFVYVRFLDVVLTLSDSPALIKPSPPCPIPWPERKLFEKKKRR